MLSFFFTHYHMCNKVITTKFLQWHVHICRSISLQIISSKKVIELLGYCLQSINFQRNIIKNSFSVCFFIYFQNYDYNKQQYNPKQILKVHDNYQSIIFCLSLSHGFQLSKFGISFVSRFKVVYYLPIIKQIT